LIKECSGNQSEQVFAIENTNPILEHDLFDDLDFREIDTLTNKIKKETLSMKIERCRIFLLTERGFYP